MEDGPGLEEDGPGLEEDGPRLEEDDDLALDADDDPDDNTNHYRPVKEVLASISRVLTDCLRAMVTRPTDVSVKTYVHRRHVIAAVITVAHDDIGRVVGKNGGTINGLRAIAKAANRTHYRLSIRVVSRGE